MGRFIGENGSVTTDLSDALRRIMRFGALPPFGGGNFRLITANTNFVVQSGTNNIRARAAGAGGGLKVASTSGAVTLTTFDGGDTAFGPYLIAGGGKAPSGTAGGLAGTTATGALRAKGGKGANLSGSTSSRRLMGGGATGSQLGDGGDGALDGNSNGAGGGVGLAHAVGQIAGRAFVGADAHLLGFGIDLRDRDLLARFPGEHFAEVWNIGDASFGTLSARAAGGGAQNSVWLPPRGFDAGSYLGEHLDGLGSQTPKVPSPLGGAMGSSAILTGDSVSTWNDLIVAQAASFGGGGPSSGGGAWCCDEIAVTPGDVIACSVGQANAEGGGGSGYIVVEW